MRFQKFVLSAAILGLAASSAMATCAFNQTSGNDVQFVELFPSEGASVAYIVPQAYVPYIAPNTGGTVTVTVPNSSGSVQQFGPGTIFPNEATLIDVNDAFDPVVGSVAASDGVTITATLTPEPSAIVFLAPILYALLRRRR